MNKHNIKERFGGFKGKVTCKLFDKATGQLVEEKAYDNLVVSTWYSNIMAVINGESGATAVINYGAVGTGTNSPASSDTQLQTELERVTVYDNSRSANVLTVTFYYDETQANGSIKEFGVVAGGTSTANTGTLCDRVSIDITKTSLNTLLITLELSAIP